MQPKDFDSFDDVPLHYRPLEFADKEINAVFGKCGTELLYWEKPSTGQKWIQIGFVYDQSGNKRCPTDICGAQCCTEGIPWPDHIPIGNTMPCAILNLETLGCRMQGAKPLCCARAPEPWNGMHKLDKCQLRCVEVIDGPDGN